jgi:acylphosphatase
MSDPVAKTVVRHVMIRGRVQGVGYRAFVEATAQQRGLDGWVRNRRDGAVEAVFAGTVAAVAQMIDACYSGPALARVAGIDAEDGDAGLLALRPSGVRFAVLATV